MIFTENHLAEIDNTTDISHPGGVEDIDVLLLF
jgi:hypothetical protein